jgi:hypothetical protein
MPRKGECWEPAAAGGGDGLRFFQAGIAGMFIGAP